MNLPQVYMCSPSWTVLSPPSPYHPSESSQCTSPKHPYRASNLDWRLVPYMILCMFQCHSPKSSHPLPHLLLGRKVMTNLDNILKSRDITLPAKVRLVKAMVFPLVMYGCEGWTIKKAKYWSFSFNISPTNEHPRLISFRADWLDFLAVQGTLKSLFQYHSSKASVLWHSAFFLVQLTPIHDYWKNHNFD